MKIISQNLKMQKIITIENIRINLAKDPSTLVRKALSENPEISIEVQKILVTGDGKGALEGLARNSHVDHSIYHELIKIAEADNDKKSFIMQGFFDNPNLPKKIKNKIVSEKYKEYFFMSFQCLSLDDTEKKYIINTLNSIGTKASLDDFKINSVNKKQAVVSIRRTKKQFQEIMQNGILKDQIQIVLEEDTPIEFINELIKREDLKNFDSWLSVALAQNPNVKYETLAKMSKSINKEVLKAIVTNKNINLEILEKISKNKDNSVRSIVANPNWFELPPFMF